MYENTGGQSTQYGYCRDIVNHSLSKKSSWIRIEGLEFLLEWDCRTISFLLTNVTELLNPPSLRQSAHKQPQVSEFEPIMPRRKRPFGNRIGQKKKETCIDEKAT